MPAFPVPARIRLFLRVSGPPARAAFASYEGTGAGDAPDVVSACVVETLAWGWAPNNDPAHMALADGGS